MTAFATHRLDGLEPDNLLAFMALLGLLRALEEARPDWRARVFWTVGAPPLRPALRVPDAVDENEVVEAAAQGLEKLAALHDFGDLADLKMPRDIAAERLRAAAGRAGDEPYVADLWAALVSDAVIDKEKTKPTPLCLLGGGRQRFMKSLSSIPNSGTLRKSGSGRNKTEVSTAECLREALFAPWLRLDNTHSFRWDPHEDVRHALRWRAPTDDKEPTQHGANRLAAIGLSVLTVVPQRGRAGEARLSVLCGVRNPNDRTPRFGWPIWRAPISLACIRALMGHPGLESRETREALGVVELRRCRRISVGNYMNVTKAEAETAP